MDLVFKGIGWLGKAFFFSRFLLQWLASERARRIVVPRLFWRLSVAGAVCDIVYAYVVKDLVFLAGPLVNLAIYVRNLALMRGGRGLDGRLLIAFIAVLLAFFVAAATQHGLDGPMPWLALGVAGQLLWASRFPLQWLVSERRGISALPPAFFALSFVGGSLLLAYALAKGDAIFIAGHALNPFLYGRSLYLALRPGDETEAGVEAAAQE